MATPGNSASSSVSAQGGNKAFRHFVVSSQFNQITLVVYTELFYFLLLMAEGLMKGLAQGWIAGINLLVMFTVTDGIAASRGQLGFNGIINMRH